MYFDFRINDFDYFILQKKKSDLLLDYMIMRAANDKKAEMIERMKKDVTKLDFANPYVPQTAFCSKSVFEEGGFDACASFTEK